MNFNTGQIVVVREPGTTLQTEVMVGACCADHVAPDVIGVLVDVVLVDLAHEDLYRCETCGNLLD